MNAAKATSRTTASAMITHNVTSTSTQDPGGGEPGKKFRIGIVANSMAPIQPRNPASNNRSSRNSFQTDHPGGDRQQDQHGDQRQPEQHDGQRTVKGQVDSQIRHHGIR